MAIFLIIYFYRTWGHPRDRLVCGVWIFYHETLNGCRKDNIRVYIHLGPVVNNLQIRYKGKIPYVIRQISGLRTFQGKLSYSCPFSSTGPEFVSTRLGRGEWLYVDVSAFASSNLLRFKIGIYKDLRVKQIVSDKRLHLPPPPRGHFWKDLFGFWGNFEKKCLKPLPPTLRVGKPGSFTVDLACRLLQLFPHPYRPED